MSQQKIEDAYPLSHLQEGLLFHSLYAPESGVYVSQLACLLQSLDDQAFEAAWRRVFDRHPALRTGFVWKNVPRPVQVVGGRVRLPIERADWRGMAPDEQERRFEEYLDDDRQRGFHPSRVPLTRLALLRVSEEGYWFLWSHHHILLDGWSGPLLLREVALCYEALRQGWEPSLPPPRPYRDFIAWLERRDQGQAEAFWRRALAGFSAPTRLPAGAPGGSGRRIQRRYGQERSRLSSRSSQETQHFAQRHRLTLNALVQGAWGLLLGRYSGEDDVVFGISVSGRPANLPGSEQMVGLFTNTLPMRIRVSPRDTVLPWLLELQELQAEMLEHEHTPLVQIQGWSEVSRGQALFESVFAFENYPVDTSLPDQLAREGGLRVERVKAHEQTHYPLSASGKLGESLGLIIEYDTERFDQSVMARMVGQFRTLLEALVADPAGRPCELPLLSPAERHQLLAEWNDTLADKPADASVHQLFEERVELDPDAVAVVCDGLDLTYRELNRRANRLARHLSGLGVEPEVRVAILLERSPELAVAILAVLKAGGAFVPLDPTYPAPRLLFMLGDSASHVLLTRESLLAGLPAELTGAVPWVEDLGAGAGREHGGPADLDLVNRTVPANLAYAIYTSGSTGRPKGSLIPHGALAGYALEMGRRLRLRGDDRILQFAALGFDVLIEEIFPAWLCGAAVVLEPPERLATPAGLARVIAERRLTGFEVPTAYWNEWVRELASTAARLPETLRFVIIGGENPSPERLSFWRERCPLPLFNAYGLTELTVTSVVHESAPGVAGCGDADLFPIGRPIANTHVYLLDRALQPVAPGVAGELYIGGNGLGRGYLARPELTADRFRPDPFARHAGERLYKTGDLVRHLPDGGLVFLGRVDHQVKVRGFRIELHEVEAALASHPAVAEAVVTVHEEGADRRLVAYLTHSGAQEPSGAELRLYLQETLPAYMIPSAFVCLDALPLTLHGKVDRRALPAPAQERSPSTTRFAAPRTPIEEMVAETWAEALGIEQVGLADDFFELGGHSLHATRILSRINRHLGMDLPLRALFEEPTVAGLAARFEAASRHYTEMPSIEPAPRDQALPLSFAQERLWLLDRLEPGNVIYHVPAALRLTGPLDVATLALSFEEITRRHEALRTGFPEVEGVPVQVVHPPAPFPLPIVDLSALAQGLREAEAMHLVREEALRPFELGRGPLLRVGLLRLGETESIGLFTMHHIICDEWSIEVLVGELAALYPAFRAGRPSPLLELPVQYADFAVWQRQWLQGEILAAEISYWRNRLEEMPAVLELPTDRPRPVVRRFRGGNCRFRLSEELSTGTRMLGRREGVTSFMTLCAVFGVLLSRYTGREDVWIGSPIAGRNRQETERLIGFFVNTVILRCHYSQTLSFRQLASRVREVVLEAHVHQEVPFERLVDELRPQRNLTHSPLFQVMFALQNESRENRVHPELEMSAVTSETGAAKFDWTLVMAGAAQHLRGALEYDADLFDPATVDRALGHFGALLEGAVENADRRLSELPLLTPAERHQLLVERSASLGGSDGERCLHRWFEDQVAAAPEAIAVVLPPEQEEGERTYLTYRELNRRANQVAHQLYAWSVGPEVPVAICLERSLEMVVALLGVLKAGAAYVPLDPTYPAERLAFLLDDAFAGVAGPVLVTQENLRSRLSLGRSSLRILNFDSDAAELAGRSGENPEPAGAPANLAYVIYTSGSTGRPKGVSITHGNVARLFDATQRWFGFGAADVWTLFHSYAFDFSVWELWGALLYGGRLVVVPYGVSRSPEAFHALIRSEGVTVLNQTPSAFRQLAGVAGEVGNTAGAGSLRLVIFGGEALEPAILTPWFSRCGDRRPQLVNMYGLTETTVHVTYRPLERADTEEARRSPIGAAIPDLHIHLLDPAQNLQPVGVPGEIHVGGAGLARGYLGRPGLTAERFVPDPFSGGRGTRLYRTGDLARLLTDGTLEFLGRIDQQVKLRGFRIELGEIEAALLEHPTVREAVVLLRAGAGGESFLAAYVVPAAGARIDQRELRGFVRQKLPPYMEPACFVELESLPLTAHGKLDRATLPAPEVARGGGEDRQRPLTPTEELLAALWSEVLGVDGFGADDDFFALGGHSLRAARLFSRIRDTFGVEVPLRVVFEAPALAELARRVEAAARSGSPALPPVVPAAREENDELPLSFAQERLWFLHQLDPDSPAYNITTAVRLLGHLDRSVLRCVLDEIVVRHEVLRTVFPGRQSRPVQRVLPPFSVALEVLDLTALPEPARAGEARRLVEAEARRPFDLARGPLLRASLLLLAEDDQAVAMSLHHVVADGWSQGVLIRELSVLYEAFRRGEASPLPPLAVQYADFARAQRQWLQGETLEALLGYWVERLSPLPPVLRLETDRPRPAAQRFRGAQRSLALRQDLSATLSALSRREGVTLFMTLLAAFCSLLHQRSGQEDMVVGTNVANRNRTEIEGLIGCFLNMLALRVDLTGNPTFRELLARIREVTLGAYAHQDLPFDRLVEVLRPDRNLSRQPLFQVKIDFQNLPMPNLELSGLTLLPVEFASGATHADLTLHLSEAGDRLSGTVEYDTDLFTAATADALLRAYGRALEIVTEQPEIHLADLRDSLTGWERLRRADQEIRFEEYRDRKLAVLKRQRVPQAPAGH